jgi:peptide/nickel transport system permease protein
MTVEVRDGYLGRSAGRTVSSRFWRLRLGIAGLVLVGTAGTVAGLAPWLAPFPPTRVSLGARLLPPFAPAAPKGRHLLGTDQLGRDVLSRIIYGARISMSISLSATVLAGGLGFAIGIVAGYRGGLTDTIVMRLADLQLAFPFILLCLAIVAALGPSVGNLILVFVVTSWPVYARMARASVLSVRADEYLQAALALGASTARILMRHVVPNVVAPMLVLGSFEMARVIIVEAALGFLGLGVPPPRPTWGTMLADGRAYIRDAWWLSTFPGLTIMLVAAGMNFLGDAFRDALDPRLR